MAKDPSFQFYYSDWLGSNRRAEMSLDQQAGYINLLCRQWADPTCSLPDDDDKLARLSELDEGWFKGGSCLLRKCFPKHPDLEGRIANDKLLELRAERDEWKAKSSKGGKKSGKVRAAKAHRKKTYDDAKQSNQTRTKHPTKREPNANTPSPSPSPSSSSSPLPKTKKPPLSPSVDSLDLITYPDGMDTPEVRQAVAVWLAYKQKRGESYKDPAGQISLLLKMPRFNGDPAMFVDAVNHSKANNWAGCFPPKESDRGNQTTSPGSSYKPGGGVGGI